MEIRTYTCDRCGATCRPQPIGLMLWRDLGLFARVEFISKADGCSDKPAHLCLTCKQEAVNEVARQVGRWKE